MQNLIRLRRGQIFFDDFDDAVLNSSWQVSPNLDTRYSLAEAPGNLTVYHGEEDLKFLVDSADEFVVDLRNDYLPRVDSNQAGLTIYNTDEDSLEFLECYDELKNESFVYQFMRIVKQGDIYNCYGKNDISSKFELIGSVSYKSSGKIGIIVKGPNMAGSIPFIANYFRMYISNEIEVLNVPVGYTVILRDSAQTVLSSRTVMAGFNGVSMPLFELVPPVLCYFTVLDEVSSIVSTSEMFALSGGDVYFFGRLLNVYVDGENLVNEGEHFLGYYINDVINFVVTLENPYNQSFNNVHIFASQYEAFTGYEIVTFSNTLDGLYVPKLLVGSIAPLVTVQVYGKVTRNLEIISSIEICKFNIGITHD